MYVYIYDIYIYIYMFPGHALYEKGLQRQKGVVPLVAATNKERFSSR